jgi:hypothetical protein
VRVQVLTAVAVDRAILCVYNIFESSLSPDGDVDHHTNITNFLGSAFDKSQNKYRHIGDLFKHTRFSLYKTAYTRNDVPSDLF